MECEECGGTDLWECKGCGFDFCEVCDDHDEDYCLEDVIEGLEAEA